MHILPNILIGQLIKVNMINILLEKSYTKCGGKAGPRSFNKKWKLSIYFDQQSDMLKSLVLLYVQVEIYQNILRLTLSKTFLKHKNRSVKRVLHFWKKNHIIIY